MEQCPAFYFSLCVTSCLCSHIGSLNAFSELLPEPALLSSDFSRSWIQVAFPGALVSIVPGTGKAKGPSLELCSPWCPLCCLAEEGALCLRSAGTERGTFSICCSCGSEISLWRVPVGFPQLAAGVLCCAALLLEHDAGFPQQRVPALCSLPYPAPRVIARFPHSELKSLLLLSTAPFIAAAQGQPWGFSPAGASPRFFGFLPRHVHTFPLSCTCRSRLASDIEFSLQT